MDNGFPQRLRKLRERKGISRRVLAELCGLSKNAIARYENENIEPTASAIRAIAECLDTSTDYLLGLKENF